MVKVSSLFFTLLSFFIYLLFPTGSLAKEADFRLIYIGALSGYVKLCG